MNEARHFGHYFRQRREDRGLTLREVENVTSIRCSYLDGIEQGKIVTMLSPVYAKGFVRQYANFLGLDGDRFIKEYGHLFTKTEKQPDVYGIGTLEPRTSSVALGKNSLLTWVLTVGLVAVVFYSMLLYFDLI